MRHIVRRRDGACTAPVSRTAATGSRRRWNSLPRSISCGIDPPLPSLKASACDEGVSGRSGSLTVEIAAHRSESTDQCAGRLAAVYRPILRYHMMKWWHGWRRLSLPGLFGRRPESSLSCVGAADWLIPALCSVSTSEAEPREIDGDPLMTRRHSSLSRGAGAD